MSNEQKDRWALFRALWLLWCVGVTVGLTIAGEWRMLIAFSAGVLCTHSIASMALTVHDRRKEK